MDSHFKKKSGFTIVELLVVIVVIAILASISIVAFNGIQSRSQNTKTTSAANAYLKGLEMFAAEKGHYPNVAKDGIGYNNCLGEDYTGNTCWDLNGTYTENTTLNGLMKTQLGNNLPMPFVDSQGMGGILYLAYDNQPPNTFWNVDGKPTNWLVYSLAGSSTRCPVGPVASYNGSTFSSTPPSSGYTAAGATGTVTCWISLTN